jgi:hypothetical protein
MTVQPCLRLGVYWAFRGDDVQGSVIGRAEAQCQRASASHHAHFASHRALFASFVAIVFRLLRSSQ